MIFNAWFCQASKLFVEIIGRELIVNSAYQVLTLSHAALRNMANLRTKILDLRGFDSNIILSLKFKVWSFRVHRGYPPVHAESTNLSSDSLSREIAGTPLAEHLSCTPVYPCIPPTWYFPTKIIPAKIA